MPKAKILRQGESYTFRSYFEMPCETEEILAELGYLFASARLRLPTAWSLSDRVPSLRQHLEEILPLVSLSNETARREILVAPVLLEVARFCQCSIRIEYPLAVNNWLKGTLDYFLRKEKSFLVIEAENADLTRGFTQLAAELIALTHIAEQDTLYGAVTVGDAWRFGLLDKTAQRILQDITLYRVPDDLEQLMGVLIGIVGGHPAVADTPPLPSS